MTYKVLSGALRRHVSEPQELHYVTSSKWSGSTYKRSPAGPSMCRAAEFRTSDFVRNHILELEPYTPIVPFDVLSEKLGRPAGEIVKLDANENPYGPPPEVRVALSQVEYPHIYPDPESRQLRAALSHDVGVPMENLLVGCGADELIDLLLRVVLEPGDTIINTPPTFGMYSFDCSINAGQVIDVPRGPAPLFQVDVEGIISAVAKHKPKVVFLTSPNNPDGSVMSEEEILRLLNLPVLVVLDEAYIEFSSSRSMISEVAVRNNLIVLRTFSKRAGLAGLRVGYGAFPSELISFMWRVKQPYNVSTVAEIAAVAALKNKKYLEDVRDALVRERERLYKLLMVCPLLAPYPSQSNFILCRAKGMSAERIKNALLERGVVVRYYSSPKAIADCIRISVGRTEDTDAVIAALQSIEKAWDGKY